MLRKSHRPLGTEAWARSQLCRQPRKATPGPMEPGPGGGSSHYGTNLILRAAKTTIFSNSQPSRQRDMFVSP